MSSAPSPISDTGRWTAKCVRLTDEHLGRMVLAVELVRQRLNRATAALEAATKLSEKRVLDLEALVRMKLTSFRRKDQVHLQDLVEVGLIDANWLARLPEVLRPRLQQLLDDPDG